MIHGSASRQLILTLICNCGDVFVSGAERQVDSAVLPGAEPSGCSLPQQKEPGSSRDWQANREALTF